MDIYRKSQRSTVAGTMPLEAKHAHVGKGFEHCRQMRLDSVRVLVAADNEPANGLYSKRGFNLVGQIDNHGVVSNVREAQVDTALPYNTDSKELVSVYAEAYVPEQKYAEVA